MRLDVHVQFLRVVTVAAVVVERDVTGGIGEVGLVVVGDAIGAQAALTTGHFDVAGEFAQALLRRVGLVGAHVRRQFFGRRCALWQRPRLGARDRRLGQGGLDEQQTGDDGQR